MLNAVMSMEKSNPYSFYVVLADGIMEIPQESNLSWITLFYALPKVLVEKRPAYLKLPWNIHQLLNSKEHCKSNLWASGFIIEKLLRIYLPSVRRFHPFYNASVQIL